MKSSALHIVCAALSICIAATATAMPDQEITEQLVRNSGGTLTIDLTPSLRKEFEPRTADADPAYGAQANPPATTTREKASGTRKAKGFRIQIFADGRNQGTLQTRARARAKQVLAKFPQFRHQVYSISKSPNYYTRIGNFANRADAEEYLGKLRRAFPGFAGEMRIVPCEVILKN